MKNLITAALILIATSGLIASPKSEPVSVLSVKRDIFYFKVEKSFIGATIEVYANDGQLILTETVIRRKAIVDFYLENPGTYTIKLKKDDKEASFTYEKKDTSKLVPIELESITASVSIAQ